MENLEYLKLFDCYGELLTENQREVCRLYFALDLSLTEIAEMKNVSKQSISDALKKSRELLETYEEKLHFAQVFASATAALGKIAREHPDLAGDIESAVRILSVSG